MKEIFESWAATKEELKVDERQDKNHKLTNKYAIRARATTAKAQGAFRKTDFAENKIRWTREQLMKVPKYDKYVPRGDEVFGKPKPPMHHMGNIVTNVYGEKGRK